MWKQYIAAFIVVDCKRGFDFGMMNKRDERPECNCYKTKAIVLRLYFPNTLKKYKKL